MKSCFLSHVKPCCAQVVDLVENNRCHTNCNAPSAPSPWGCNSAPLRAVSELPLGQTEFVGRLEVWSSLLENGRCFSFCVLFSYLEINFFCFVCGWSRLCSSWMCMFWHTRRATRVYFSLALNVSPCAQVRFLCWTTVGKWTSIWVTTSASWTSASPRTITWPPERYTSMLLTRNAKVITWEKPSKVRLDLFAFKV